MNQNTSSSETLIKQEFIDILTASLKELRTDITAEIKSEIRASEMRMLTKMDELEFRMEDKMRKNTSAILTKFDLWAKELENAREDRIITSKILKNHEKRIKKLEQN